MRKNKKKEEITVRHDRDVNHNILNIITPSGIDFDRSHINVSENVGTILCISKYPTDAAYGWLTPICNLEGTSTMIEFRYTASDRLAKQLNKRISELNTNLETAKQESDRQGIANAIYNLKELVSKIVVKGEPVGYVNIMIYITATNSTELMSRIKRVQSALSVVECGTRTLIYKQDLAFKAMVPYGLPNYEYVSNVGERPMPISSLMGGFPNASSGLNDPYGFYLGKTREGRLVILDQWIRNKDRTNSNWYISGAPGVGKSTAVKLIEAKSYFLGDKVIVFDPEQEYKDLARSEYINGDIIDCASGVTGRINPLQIRAFDISASGMSAQRVRMDIAAENIANMDTTRTESGGPYRRKNVLLESYSDTSFAQAMENAARGKGVSSRHAGVRVSGIVEDDREAKKVYNPDHPDADADGYVTMPNVDVLKETVDSMSATRSYEANVTALNAIKLMAQKALEIGK